MKSFFWKNLTEHHFLLASCLFGFQLFPASQSTIGRRDANQPTDQIRPHHSMYNAALSESAAEALYRYEIFMFKWKKLTIRLGMGNYSCQSLLSNWPENWI